MEILVNNAGIFPITPLFETTDEQWDRVQSTNIGGAFRCSREAGKVMAAAGNGGVIINLASTQAFRAGAAGLSAYTSSKGAIVAFTQALAVELGQFGIRAVAVAPTVVDTPGVQANMPAFEAAGVGDLIASISAQLPLGRTGVPDDIARVIAFLASDLAVFMAPGRPWLLMCWTSGKAVPSHVKADVTGWVVSIEGRPSMRTVIDLKADFETGARYMISGEPQF